MNNCQEKKINRLTKCLTNIPTEKYLVNLSSKI